LDTSKLLQSFKIHTYLESLSKNINFRIFELEISYNSNDYMLDIFLH